MTCPHRSPMPRAFRAPGFLDARGLTATLSACLIAILVGAPREALAHHMLDGAVPNTLMGGLLSGLAHPVIGPDHLVFLIAIGVLAAVASTAAPREAGRGAWISRPARRFLPLAFVGASLVGCSGFLAGGSSLYAEVGVAASLLAVALLLIAGSRTSYARLAVGFALAGLTHGFAYGDSIVGAEPTPVAGYLAGLAVVQVLVALGAFAFTQRLAHRYGPRHTAAIRALGLVVGLIGVTSLIAVS